MNEPASHRFTGISPVIPVADITAALEFYCASLGFELGWKSGEPATHAKVCRDDIDVTLVLNPSGVGSGNVYVYTSGVDGCHSDLSTRGIQVGALENRDYGMRDFLVRDPFGNRLVFGQPTA